MSNALPVSQRAREVIKGAYDLHVHSGPDVMKRIASDLEIASAFEAHGLGGYVIKQHYVASGGACGISPGGSPYCENNGINYTEPSSWRYERIGSRNGCT
jgi:hypothetical protein